MIDDYSESQEIENLNTEELTLDIDSKNVFKMILGYENIKIFFFIENVKHTKQYYELTTFLPEIQKQDKNFLLFNSAKSIATIIKKSILAQKYKYTFNNESFKLSIENNIFENDEASITIPSEKKFSMIQVFLDMKNELQKYKEGKIQNKELIQEDKIQLAKESFEGTKILNEEEKVLISKWIHPKKALRFNLAFSTNIDGNSTASTFHKYCDGVSPTVTIVMDTNGNKFGGYTTLTWNEPCTGESYARDPDAFIFNLTKKLKYLQPNKFGRNSIYRNKQYGPTFGGGNNGYNLYISDGCTGNNNSKSYVDQSYKTNNWNLIDNSGSISFKVNQYEVYHVVNGLFD